MSQHDTGVRCIHCTIHGYSGSIVAEVEDVPTESAMHIPIGPGSKNYYRRTITSFHCNDPRCGTMFYGVPGRPNAAEEILRELREVEDRADRAEIEKQVLEALGRKNRTS
jgi:hypothetical protein